LPFTLAHPALILPFFKSRKKWVSFTGLLVGSVVPDFEYFILGGGGERYGHSLAGVFWFDIPLGLILAFLYHNVVRDPLITHFPRFFQKKMMPFQYFNWNRYFQENWLNVCLCIVIGAATHLFWDSFTHADGFFVQRIGFLQELVPYKERRVTMNNIVHLVFSALGSLVVIIAWFQLPQERKRRTYKKIAGFWLVLILLFGILFFLGGWQLTTERMRKYYYLYTSSFVIIGMSSALLALLLTTLLFRNHGQTVRRTQD
jgi:hypothetical protein